MSQKSRIASIFLAQPLVKRWDAIASGPAIVRSCAWHLSPSKPTASSEISSDAFCTLPASVHGHGPTPGEASTGSLTAAGGAAEAVQDSLSPDESLKLSPYPIHSSKASLTQHPSSIFGSPCQQESCPPAPTGRQAPLPSTPPLFQPAGATGRLTNATCGVHGGGGGSWLSGSVDLQALPPASPAGSLRAAHMPRLAGRPGDTGAGGGGAGQLHSLAALCRAGAGSSSTATTTTTTTSSGSLLSCMLGARRRSWTRPNVLSWLPQPPQTGPVPSWHFWATHPDTGETAAAAAGPAVRSLASRAGAATAATATKRARKAAAADQAVVLPTAALTNPSSSSSTPVPAEGESPPVPKRRGKRSLKAKPNESESDAAAATQSPPASAASAASPTRRRRSASSTSSSAAGGPSTSAAAAAVNPSPRLFGAQDPAPWHPGMSAAAAELAPPDLSTALGFDARDDPQRYVEVCDPHAVLSGSAIFDGSDAAWHAHHVAEILNVPARGPGVPEPSLDAFRRQLDLEAQCMNIALEDYRRTLASDAGRGVMETAPPSKRLMAMWVPQLTERLQQLYDQFLALKEDVQGPKCTASAAADGAPPAPKRPPGRPKLVRKDETDADFGEAASSPASAARAPTGSPAGAEAGAARPPPGAGPRGDELEELVKWIPLVLPIPPPLLARLVVAGMLNTLVVHEYQESDLPSGMSLSITVADGLSRRVMDSLSYMQACEMVAEKRRELRAAAKELEEAEKARAEHLASQQPQEGLEAAKVAEGVDTAEQQGSLSEMDRRIAQAVVRLQGARSLLNDVRQAAAASQPRGLEADVVRDGTTAASRLRVARRAVLRQVTRVRLQRSLQQAGRVQEWTPVTRASVGAALLLEALNLLRIHNPDTGNEEPAFTHSTTIPMTWRGGAMTTPGLVIAHPQLLRLAEGDAELRRMLQPRFMPMLVEPRPWRNVRAGGTITQTVPVIKTRYSPSIQARVSEAHRTGCMQPLYDALTVLGNVPWRVNRRVLEVMEAVVRAGGGKLGLPSSDRTALPTPLTTALNDSYRAVLGPSTPAQCGTPYLRLQREGARGGQLLVGAGAMSPGERKQYRQEYEAVRNSNRNISGQRSAAMYKVEIAKQYAGVGLEEQHAGGGGPESSLPPLPLRPAGSSEPVVFFQPHHVDFRGRAYPLHPHLSHLGDDSTRGLLQFGVGKPLGERGFRWMLIQVANLWGRGIDKLPLEERAAWGERQLPAVLASAARPLEAGAGDWWQGAERPWQLLATCFEIQEAMGCSSGPAAYVSHQPVNQDGTCNGLQHYAALGRDRRGGAAVNLLPASRPQDVYQAVADAVAGRVSRDREAGRSEAVKVYGCIDRKLVKQTVMTYVYGVTIIGAREQIENRLEERGWGNERERRKVSTYLARLTFESMGDVFGPAVAVRSWLESCAKYATSSGHPVIWRSPLGFPVEQPYRNLPTVAVRTPLQSLYLRDARSEADAPIDRRKQRSGFAPNYVHSVDGAHMMMAAMEMRRAGHCFAAVHDSFWTHASDVDDMNRIIRNTFIELHSRPLLQELRSELAANPLYRNATAPLPPVPKPGDLDLDAIRGSTYFFS